MENKINQRLFGMLGFAMRAGKLVIGTEQICKSMAKGQVRLVVVSVGASALTKKKLFTKSDYYGVSAIEADIDTERLGRLIGKTYAPAAVAVTDNGFAVEIKKAVEEKATV